ncbi:MAG: 3-isopropylmalate dehydratase large subunit [bacterium JZ-2024 1]
MGNTLVQNILSRKSKGRVEVGEIVEVTVDMTMAHDISGPHTAKVMQKEMGVEKVWDPGKVVLIPDHFVPAKDIASAELSLGLRKFALEQGAHYFEIGRAGICHVVMVEEGFVTPGDVVVGGDSHTCTYGAVGAFATGVGATDLAAVWALGTIWLRVPPTIALYFKGDFPPWVYPKDVALYLMKIMENERANYKALEFHDLTDKKIPMEGRLTISNMTVEAGGKVGIFLPDEVTFAYLNHRARKSFEPVYPDKDADYEEVVEVDISALEPIVAQPFLPSNIAPVSELEKKKIRIDQVIIGSCTNARLSDLRIVGHILKGKRIHPDIRVILLPGSQRVFREALKEGLIDIFMDAGITVSTSTCGPCVGGHMGVLAKGEKAVSTTNRNFRGRMGHPEAEVYLASPAVAAATAILGYLASPATLGIPPIPVDPEPVLVEEEIV